MKAGIRGDLSNAEYHAVEGISSTDLKTINSQTPAHWKHKKDNPVEAKPEWNLGTAVHALVLEPDTVEQQIAVAPKVDRRTKVGKAEYAEFLATSERKTVVTADQWIAAGLMAESIMNNPQAAEVLQDGKAEQSVFSLDPVTGYTKKARPDYWMSHLLVDIKTTRDASPSQIGFPKHAAQLGYHIQAAWYLDVCSEHRPAEDFVFICVESEPPYLTACYLADPQFIQIGRLQYLQAYDTLTQCINENKYPGYSPAVEYLSLPNWMIRQYENAA